MGSTEKILALTGKTREEKIAALAGEYGEIQTDMAEAVRKFKVTSRYLSELGMPKEKAWATLVVSAAESLDLDLETSEGMGAAALLAEFQLRLG